MEAIEINPKFEDLNSSETIINHIKSLEKEIKNIVAEQPLILEKLLSEIKDVDFHDFVFEKYKYKGKKVEYQHYLVISIEEVLSTAKLNKWDLCKNNDFIYLFNGAFWEILDKEVFQKFLGVSSEKMGVPILEARYHNFRTNLFKQFLATAYLPTPESDKNKVLINLQNGTFEITSKGNELREFSHKDFITYQLPFDYNPKAKAPMFENFLNEVLPDKQLQMILAEYLGNVFMKNGNDTLKEEKALILYGTGANGKSVFFEVVNALLGAENTSTYSLQDLTNENGYYRAKIANKLVNYASEINGKLESDIFKQMASGEPITARLPYGQPMQLKQYAKMIFNCNELPKDAEQTNGYFRRFLIIPFNVTIPEEKQDKQLHTKIIENELSGVFNWVLDGLKRLIEQKHFTHSETTKEVLEQYKIESDSVKMFINENDYQKCIDSYILIKELYNDYKMFCLEDGYRPVKKTNFISRLKGTGIVIDRINKGNVAYLSNI